MGRFLRFDLRDAVVLLLVLVLAALIRVAYVSACANVGAADGLFHVQDNDRQEIGRLVDALVTGKGFATVSPLGAESAPTAYTSVGYPGLVALLDWPVRNRGVTLSRVRWGQAGLGALTACLYFLLTRRAFNSRLAAALAGVFCAVYPLWVVNTAELNDGVLASFLLAFALYLGVRGGQQGGALTGLLYGAVLGALAMVRAALLPFAVVALVWFLWRCRRLASGWLTAVVAFLAFVLSLAPWHVRNYRVFGEPTPLVDSAFLHLWMAHNSHASGGPQPGPLLAETLDETGPGKADRLRSLHEPERYRALATEVWNEVRQHPAAAFARRLRAGVAFFMGSLWVEERRIVWEDPAPQADRSLWWIRLGPALLTGALLLALTLGALGWRWSYAWRRQAMPSSLAVIWVFLPYFLSHAEAYHGPRLPLDGLFLSYAAFAFACLFPPTARHLFDGENAPRE